MLKANNILLYILTFTAFSVFAKQPAGPGLTSGLAYPILTRQLYAKTGTPILWLRTPARHKAVTQQVLALIDSELYLGIGSWSSHYTEIKMATYPTDSAHLKRLDYIISDAIIAVSKGLLQGTNTAKWIKSDEISGRYALSDDSLIIARIITYSYSGSLTELAATFEPTDTGYDLLKKELKIQMAAQNQKLAQQLLVSINLHRWISHFHFEKAIVVNIPSASLKYFENNSLKLQMKVVAGKTATRSPRFATWCNQVILYPYWNVPKDIAARELLPRVRRNPSSMERMNMQLVNSGGKVVDYHNIKWSAYSNHNFPYRFRQCTGCDNSLGVIKFNLTDPFDVYLHDTNFKLAFLKDKRFLSHGCIRVEQPLALGNYLLDNKIDSNFLKSCLKGQEPVINTLEKKAPVFVVYMTAEANSGKVVYHKDVYGLFK